MEEPKGVMIGGDLINQNKNIKSKEQELVPP